MQPLPEISLQYIEAVINCPDPVLRNLQITQTYSDINAALSGLWGPDNISWCGYAAWASKTAGKFIRKDSIQHLIEEFLRDKSWGEQLQAALPSALRWFGWKMHINTAFLEKLLNETAREAASEVAAGNLLVFTELAPIYEKFLHSIAAPPSYQAEELDGFLVYLRSNTAEEREKLAMAFSHYYQAIFAPTSKARAEHLFLANLLVGYHEQIRLDPAINGSIQAPFEQVVKKQLLERLDHWIESTVPAWLHRLIATYLQYRLSPLINHMAARWSAMITEHWMRIEVPAGSLDLSEDIPLSPYQSPGMFPRDLELLELPELLTVLADLDLSPNSTTGSGAKDWGQLADRMNFIADFFRSAQQDQKMFQPTFSAAQITAIKNGQVPAGRL